MSVQPLAECAVRVEAQGFLARELTFDAPAAGMESTQTIVLHKDPALAQLSVELKLPEDSRDAPITQATFRFAPLDRAGPAVTDFVRHAASAGGIFQLADLPAGRWSVSAFATGVYEHYRDCWCEAKTVVQLISRMRSISLAMIWAARVVPRARSICL